MASPKLFGRLSNARIIGSNVRRRLSNGSCSCVSDSGITARTSRFTSISSSTGTSKFRATGKSVPAGSVSATVALLIATGPEISACTRSGTSSVSVTMVFCSSGRSNVASTLSRTGIVQSIVASSRPTKLLCSPFNSGSATSFLMLKIKMPSTATTTINTMFTMNEKITMNPHSRLNNAFNVRPMKAKASPIARQIALMMSRPYVCV